MIFNFCQNARTYNEDGSVLFQDANDIEVCLSPFPSEARVWEPSPVPLEGKISIYSLGGAPPVEYAYANYHPSV